MVSSTKERQAKGEAMTIKAIWHDGASIKKFPKKPEKSRNFKTLKAVVEFSKEDEHFYRGRVHPVYIIGKNGTSHTITNGEIHKHNSCRSA